MKKIIVCISFLLLFSVSLFSQERSSSQEGNTSSMISNCVLLDTSWSGDGCIYAAFNSNEAWSLSFGDFFLTLSIFGHGEKKDLAIICSRIIRGTWLSNGVDFKYIDPYFFIWFCSWNIIECKNTISNLKFKI